MNPFTGGPGPERPNNVIDMTDPKKVKRIVRNVMFGLIGLIVLIGAATSFYTVQEHEQAAILTFGNLTHTSAKAGLQFKLPYPIQQVVKVPTKLTQRIHIGYRELDGRTEAVESEALMITGDENIVSADAVVEWNIMEVEKYLYNIDNAEHFLRNSAISAIRSVMGATNLDYAITDGKTVIQTQVKEKLVQLQKEYDTGINIIDVKFQDIEPPEGSVQQAFKEVTNAREEKNTKINRAEQYVNEVLPKARGEAQALIENAEAEKRSRILNAEGDVAKFNAIYAEYAKSKEVTESRLILETLETILPNAKIIITDGSGDTVKYLPLNELMKGSTSASPATKEVKPNE